MYDITNEQILWSGARAPKRVALVQDGARFWSLVAEFGLTGVQIADTLHVLRGERAVLNTLAGQRPVLPATSVSTSDAPTYRSWIGGLEGEIPAHWRIPGARSTRSGIGRDELTAEERRDNEDAAKIYFFGNPAHVATYRDAIERCYAPFEAVVYAVRHLTVEAGASLLITGVPTVLLVESMEIEEGGRLTVIDTPCRVHVGTLTKHGTPAVPLN